MISNYFQKRSHSNKWIGQSILIIMFLIFCIDGTSQVRKNFTPRISAYSPGQEVYHIKGDYTMIGNTNLTMVRYSNNGTNSNSQMRYVDIDSDASTQNSSTATLTLSEENGAIPACSNILFAGLYWSGRGLSRLTTTQMRTVKFKAPGQISYQTLVAESNNIQFPGDEGMYAAFYEVTDLVKDGGLGQYWVADIALSEGDGSEIGYYGGWGMVVVYENSAMKWRDITVFDGYAYVIGGNARHKLDVSGFKAVQNGDVNIKMGFIAGEGDRHISGDYFEIERQNSNEFIALNHTGNGTTNFFNSSIITGGNARNPNLLNNTGLDISMFNVPNANNQVIANNQTTTTFRYGSTQDTYIIFNITFGVDAYVPEVTGILSVNSINGVSNPTIISAEPSEEVEFKLEIKNKGTESTNNTMVVIPVPFTTKMEDINILYNVYSPLTSFNAAPYYDPDLGATGSIVWDIGTLPVPSNPDAILADLTFQLKVTGDCPILTNPYCSPIISLNGTISGTGQLTNTNFDFNFIQGYETDGNCQGVEIPTPLEIPIDWQQYVADNCGSESTIDFDYCNINNSPILPSELLADFPVGVRFFNTYPVTDNSIEYTDSNPFSGAAGTTKYYAVMPGTSPCFYEFKINVYELTSENMPITEDVTYCLNEQAVPLIAYPSDHPTSPSLYTLHYFYDNDPTSQSFSSITPTTGNSYVTTFYVAQSIGDLCFGPLKPIVVNVINLADLELTKKVDNTEPKVGDNVTFTVTVTNTGPCDVTGVKVKDVIPPGLSYISHTVTTGKYKPDTGIWNLKSKILDVNDTEELTITVSVNPNCNTITNTAEIMKSSRPDPDSTPDNGN